jgi:hypothetical protein
MYRYTKEKKEVCMLLLIGVVTVLAWLRGWKAFCLIPLGLAFLWGLMGGWLSTQIIQLVCLGAIVWMWGLSPPPAELINKFHEWLDEQKEQWNKTINKPKDSPPTGPDAE